jgi:hypothetical protein
MQLLFKFKSHLLKPKPKIYIFELFNIHIRVQTGEHGPHSPFWDYFLGYFILGIFHK